MSRVDLHIKHGFSLDGGCCLVHSIRVYALDPLSMNKCFLSVGVYVDSVSLVDFYQKEPHVNSVICFDILSLSLYLYLVKRSVICVLSQIRFISFHTWFLICAVMCYFPTAAT